MRRIASRPNVTRIVAVAVILGGTISCAAPAASPNGPPEPEPTSTTTVEPTPDDTPRPTPSTSPTPIATQTSTTFESPFYRYAITLPPGTATRPWNPADRLWDGTAKLEMGSPFMDRTGVAEGTLYLFGAEDPSLETWFARVEGNGVRFHRCKPAQNRADVTINDVPAIAFTQSCELGTNMARVALWKDGYGIGVWLGETLADKLVAARDRAIELLATLEWKSG